MCDKTLPVPKRRNLVCIIKEIKYSDHAKRNADFGEDKNDPFLSNTSLSHLKKNETRNELIKNNKYAVFKMNENLVNNREQIKEENEDFTECLDQPLVDLKPKEEKILESVKDEISKELKDPLLNNQSEIKNEEVIVTDWPGKISTIEDSNCFWNKTDSTVNSKNCKLSEKSSKNYVTNEPLKINTELIIKDEETEVENTNDEVKVKKISFDNNIHKNINKLRTKTLNAVPKNVPNKISLLKYPINSRVNSLVYEKKEKVLKTYLKKGVLSFKKIDIRLPMKQEKNTNIIDIPTKKILSPRTYKNDKTTATLVTALLKANSKKVQSKFSHLTFPNNLTESENPTNNLNSSNETPTKSLETLELSGSTMSKPKEENSLLNLLQSGESQKPLTTAQNNTINHIFKSLSTKLKKELRPENPKITLSIQEINHIGFTPGFADRSRMGC